MLNQGHTVPGYITVFPLAQLDRSRTANHFQYAVLIVCVRFQPSAECAKITTRVQIAQARVAPNVGCNRPFVTPGSRE